MGERPAVHHLRHYGLAGFTSGSVCIAPRLSTKLLNTLIAGSASDAPAALEPFLTLERLRDTWGPIRVLHDAVTLAGIADMGPIMPPLTKLSDDELPSVRAAAVELRAREAADAHHAR